MGNEMILVPELPLGGAGVAGLLDEVDAHRVAGRMRGVALDAGRQADVVPEAVDDCGSLYLHCPILQL
jgi:hypothetical protein